jgi:hypothetical protein
MTASWRLVMKAESKQRHFKSLRSIREHLVDSRAAMTTKPCVIYRGVQLRVEGR